MDPKIASTLTDAYACQIRSQMDYSSPAGRDLTMRMAPYLAPLVRGGIRALDLGSSFGKSAMLLSELGANVTGVDVSFGAILFATHLGQKLRAKSSFALADYSKLPFVANSFELVLFPHNVVECSPVEFESIVCETSRVLTKQGVFAISIASKWALPGEPEPRLRDGTITIPGIGVYAYPTYLWSQSAVEKKVLTHFSSVERIETIERAGVWLVFRKV